MLMIKYGLKMLLIVVAIIVAVLAIVPFFHLYLSNDLKRVNEL